jgi:hypothetical protein
MSLGKPDDRGKPKSQQKMCIQGRKPHNLTEDCTIHSVTAGDGADSDAIRDSLRADSGPDKSGEPPLITFANQEVQIPK